MGSSRLRCCVGSGFLGLRLMVRIPGLRVRIVFTTCGFLGDPRVCGGLGFRASGLGFRPHDS